MFEPMRCALCGTVTSGRALFYPGTEQAGFPRPPKGQQYCVCMALCDEHELTDADRQRLEQKIALMLAIANN